MKNKFFYLLCCVCCIIPSFAQVKVACVGNSITYGSRIPNRDQNSYPAQLQAMLGNTYEVRNFGRGGATLLNSGDRPYTKTKEYKEALAFNPDIVLIKLGTNDSKLKNRNNLKAFVDDYNSLIKSFRENNPEARIIILTPIKAFTQPDTISITPAVIEEQIRPMVEQIAFSNNLEIIHLENLITEPHAYLIPDKIHPSPIGAAMLATRIFTYLSTDDKRNPVQELSLKGSKTENYHGFECVSFRFNNADCKIAKPKQARAGNPWLWRAKEWGSDIQTDQDLLEQGFHIAYYNASSAKGQLKQWSKFYKMLQKKGFSKNPVTEGFENINIQSELALNGCSVDEYRKMATPNAPVKSNDLVKFILENTGCDFILTNKPIPGYEYRTSAGWKEGADWHANHEEISSILQNNKLDVLLIGNSITQGFGGNRQIITYKPGKERLDAVLKDKKWESAGITSDRTENIIYRLVHGNYASCAPKTVILTVGINNLGGGNSVKETFCGVKKCIEMTREMLPDSKLIVFGIFPAGKEKDSPLRSKVYAVNELITEYANDNAGFQFINLADKFINEDGSLKKELYMNDLLHLSGAGYEMWSQEIGNLVD